MSNERDVEEGIVRSPSLDEENNVGATDIEDANLPFLASLPLSGDLPIQNIAAAGVAAETLLPSLSPLFGPEQIREIRDDVGTAPSTVTDSAGRLPGATRKISVEELMWPFSSNFDTAVGDVNSFFAASSLFADSSARNATDVAAAKPPSLSTSLAGLEEPGLALEKEEEAYIL